MSNTTHYDQIDNHNFNPLDCVEDVLSDHNWIYSRMNTQELVVDIAGKSCEYRLMFVWQKDLGALQLCCQYNINILPENPDLIAQALMNINSDVWMGHFEVTYDTMTPRFRHTSLMRGHDTQSDYEQIEDLVDISLNQCEHYFHVFDLLSMKTKVSEDVLSFAMMGTVGES